MLWQGSVPGRQQRLGCVAYGVVERVRSTDGDLALAST